MATPGSLAVYTRSDKITQVEGRGASITCGCDHGRGGCVLRSGVANELDKLKAPMPATTFRNILQAMGTTRRGIRLLAAMKLRLAVEQSRKLARKSVTECLGKKGSSTLWDPYAHDIGARRSQLDGAITPSSAVATMQGGLPRTIPVFQPYQWRRTTVRFT